MTNRTQVRSSSTQQKYNKMEILKGLRDSITAIERIQKSFEERVAEWRTNSIETFISRVQKWEHPNYFDTDSLKPPTANRLCDNWQVQGINRSITRINAMTPDKLDGSIRLRVDDVVFEQIAVAACL